MTTVRRTSMCLLLLLGSVLLRPGEARGESPTQPGYEAEVHLDNGSVLAGLVVAETLDQLVLQVGGAEPTTVDKAVVRRIESVVQGKVAQPAPRPTVAAPLSEGRFIGLGTNIGVGFGYRDTYNASLDGFDDEWHDDVELPGLELRLFPTDRFSVDLLWQIGDMTWFREEFGAQIGCMMIFAHFYVADGEFTDGRAGFSVAPGLLFVSNIDAPEIGAVGLGTRVGVDLTTPDDLFGLGVYARPFFHVTKDYADVTHGAFEMVFEITWTWYAPRPVGL